MVPAPSDYGAVALSVRPSPLSAAFIFSFSLISPAAAQVPADLSVTIDRASGFRLSRDNCDREIETALDLVGELADTASDAEGVLRLVYKLASPDPNDECNPPIDDECSLDSATGASCACIGLGQPNAKTVEQTITLAKIAGNDVCDREGDSIFEFYVEFGTFITDDPTVIRSAGKATLEIDRTRPPAPTRAPRIRSGEASLKLQLDPVISDDVESYEVCRRARTEEDEFKPVPLDVTTDTTNDDLRDGFTGCIRIPTDQTTTQLSGLNDGDAYWIAYATYDGAGNRSANSPVALGVPGVIASDFASRYADRGGSELGGCSAGVGTQPATPWWLGAVLIVWVGWRRRR